MENKKHDPMDEEYWKKQIAKSISMIAKDKLISTAHEKDLIKKLKNI